MSRSNQKHNSLELTILVAFKNMTFSLNNCVFYYIALAQKLGVSPKRKLYRNKNATFNLLKHHSNKTKHKEGRIARGRQKAVGKK